MKDVGLTLKHISVISGINISTLYKYATTKKVETLESKSGRGVKYPPESVRLILKHFFADKHPVNPQKKVIAGFHFKGGTGKSSINTETAVMLSLLGYKVLLVDGDQQGHASHIVGFNASEKLYTLYDCLKNNLELKDIIINISSGLDVIPANLSLSDIEDVFRNMDKKDAVKCISSLFSEVQDDYDYIIFDTAPSITDLNRNIFYYADVVQIICDTQPASVHSLSQIQSYLSEFSFKYETKNPEIIIIPNKYEDRASSSLETVAFIQQNWKEYIIPDFAVRKSEDVPRAFLQQSPISFFCKVNSIAMEDFSIVTRNLVQKTQLSIG
jgi:chromosome partitioning protein